jgi:hypothetical protein
MPLHRNIYLFISVVSCLPFMFLSGQPRRHLLTTGWSVFVSSKRLVAGDAFIFMRCNTAYLLAMFDDVSPDI